MCSSDLANILAGPLVELAAQLAAHTVPGGRIALSGILESQAQAVAESYRPWFDLQPMTQREEWVRLDGARRAS